MGRKPTHYQYYRSDVNAYRLKKSEKDRGQQVPLDQAEYVKWSDGSWRPAVNFAERVRNGVIWPVALAVEAWHAIPPRHCVRCKIAFPEVFPDGT